MPALEDKEKEYSENNKEKNRYKQSILDLWDTVKIPKL
jgi:hypothetical protein